MKKIFAVRRTSWMLLFLILMLMLGVIFAKSEIIVKGEAVNKGYELFYSQKELADKLIQALNNQSTETFADVAEFKGNFNFEADVDRSLEETALPGTIQYEWLKAQLAGKVVIDTADQGTAKTIVAFDAENKELTAVVINKGTESYRYTLDIARLEGKEMNTATQTFEVMPVLKPVEEAAGDQSQPGENLTGTETPTEGTAGAEEPSAGDEDAKAPGSSSDGSVTPGAENPKGQTPETNKDHQEVPPEISPAANLVQMHAFRNITTRRMTAANIKASKLDQEAQNAQEETVKTKVLTGYKIEAGESDSFSLPLSGLTGEVPVNGMSKITVKTGMLHGGVLSNTEEEPPLRPQLRLIAPGNQDVTTLRLDAGLMNPVNGAPGLLRVYSGGDIPVGETAAPSAADYVTYSKTSHAVFYDITPTSVLEIKQNGANDSGVGGMNQQNECNFTFELYNSNPVTIGHLTNRTVGNGGAVLYNRPEHLTLNFKGMGAGGNTFNIHNNPAVTQQSGALNLKGNLHVYQANLNVDGNSGTGIYAERSIVNSRVSSGDVIFTHAGAKVYATGGTGGINLATGDSGQSAVEALEGSEVIADAKDSKAAAAIAVNEEVHAKDGSLIVGEKALIGIRTKQLITAQSTTGGSIAGIYANINDVANPLRSRIVGRGSDTGIEMQGITTASDRVYVGAGTLVVAEGTKLGMKVRTICSILSGATVATLYRNDRLGRPELTSTLADKQYGTLIARGTGTGSTGIFFPLPGGSDVGVDNGTRFIALGKKTGLLVAQSSSTAKFSIEKQAEVFAYGGEVGIDIDSLQGTYSTLELDNLGRAYARGGRYGVRSRSNGGGSMLNVFGTESDRNNAGTGSLMTAIGGIGSDADITEGFKLSDKVYADPDNWLTAADLKFSDLPEPTTDEKGIIPSVTDQNGNLLSEKKNTAGLYIRNGYIAAYDRGTVLKTFGGQYGGVNTYLDETTGEITPATLAAARDKATYIASYEGAKAFFSGGEYGAVANTYVHCWSQGYGPYDPEGGNLDSGSVYGVLTGNSLLKASGKKIGIWALGNNAGGFGYVHSLGEVAPNILGRTYIYGYGEINGIRSDNTSGVASLDAVPGSMIVAETIADTKAAAGSPHAEPAILMKNSGGKINIQASGNNIGVIHEIYSVKNYDIITQPPYQLNKEVAALGKQMGTNPETLLRLNWTTPVNHPNTSPDGRDWLDYDAADDQKLIKPGTANGISGLIAFGNAAHATLVGEAIGSTTNMMYGATGGLLTGAGHYRLTLRGVNMNTRNTMNIQMDLNEDFLNTIKHMGSAPAGGVTPPAIIIPAGTVYELTYKNLNPADGTEIEPPVTLDLTASDVIDVAAGTIKLTKLRMGDYWLKPKKDIGIPYQDLPAIHFKTRVDTTAAVPEPVPGSPGSYPNYYNYWYEKVYLADKQDDWANPPETPVPSTTVTINGQAVIQSLLNAKENNRPYATVTAQGDLIADNSGKGTPTILPSTVNGTDYNVEAFRVGKINLYYFRKKDNIDFRLQDKDSKEVLPGTFSVKAYQGSTEVTSLAKTLTSTTSGGQITWPTLLTYSGLTYQFTQVSVDKQPYIKLDPTNSYKVTPETDGTNYTVTADPAMTTDYTTWGDNQAAAGAPHYHVRAYNDLPVIQVPLHLVDDSVYRDNIASPQNTLESLSGLHVTGGGFKLEVMYANQNTWSDVTNTAVTDRGDGTFTLRLKPHRLKYRLTQTEHNEYYYIRQDANELALTDLAYAGNNVTDYKIRNILSPLPGDGGWIEPVSWDSRSAWITNIVSTVPFSFTKLGEEGTGLGNTTFKLYPCKEKGTQGHTHSNLAVDQSGNCWDIQNPLTVTSTSAGLVDFGNVLVGDYMLAEVQAASGYALPRGQWLVTLSSTGITIAAKASDGDTPPAFKYENGAYSVLNYKNSILPNAGTGGITMFTIIGLVLVGCTMLGVLIRLKRSHKTAAVSQRGGKM